MPKFRKLPAIIDAVLFQPDLDDPRKNLPAGVYYSGTTDDYTDHHWFIGTLEGRMRVRPGDWVITGVNGERYPCKPDIFAKTYEPA